MSSLKPVRTREDIHSWLTFEEVEKEVFAAFVGAQSHARRYDFGKDALDFDPPVTLEPGTVVCADDGKPWHDRWNFLEYMLCGIVWRLQALAEHKGVDLRSLDMSDALVGPAGCVNANEKLAHPYWNYLAGEVHTVTPDQLTPAQLKALKAGKPVTVSKGTIEGL